MTVYLAVLTAALIALTVLAMVTVHRVIVEASRIPYARHGVLVLALVYTVVVFYAWALTLSYIISP